MTRILARTTRARTIEDEDWEQDRKEDKSDEKEQKEHRGRRGRKRWRGTLQGYHDHPGADNHTTTTKKINMMTRTLMHYLHCCYTGRFPKQGDPKIDPKMITTILIRATQHP